MNQFGQFFRLSIYGESHGGGVGIIIDGIPPGINFDQLDFQTDFDRRKPGIKGTTSRIESDVPVVLSGVFNSFTTGSPLHLLFRNENVKSEDYLNLRDTPRPGHSDFVAHNKFRGYNDPRGGGHFSGRLTLPLVAAGVIAKHIIRPINIQALLIEVGGSTHIEEEIQKAMDVSDSVGGLVNCVVSKVPIGLGEPFFLSVESIISQLAFSIPAVKGIEFGSGFSAAKMRGSQHNDEIQNLSGKTRTNYSGGINGGISNGNDIEFKVAIKPSSSIGIEQKSINLETGNQVSLKVKGRHDSCIALRVPVVLEAITAIALAELWLFNNTKI